MCSGLQVAIQALDSAAAISIVEGGKNFRAELGISGNAVRLVMRNKKGVEQMALVQNDDDAKLMVLDKLKKMRLGIGTTNGHPSVILLDKNENMRAILGATEAVNPKTNSKILYSESSLIFLDNKEKAFFTIP